MKKIISLILGLLIIVPLQVLGETNIEFKIRIADKYIESKKYSQAISIYEGIVNDNKNDEEIKAEVIQKLLHAYLQNNDYSKVKPYYDLVYMNNSENEAITGFEITENSLSKNIAIAFNEIQKTKEKDASKLINYGKLLYQAGDIYYETDNQEYSFAILHHYISAYSMFEKAQKLEPKNSETYFYQGRLIMDLNGDFPSAEAKLKKALQLKKDNFEYYYRLGNAYMHQEKNKEAKIVFLQGIKLNNKYEKLRLNLGNVYYDLGDRKNGFNAYQSGIKVCSEMCASFYYNLGIEFSNIDNEKAKNYYKKALEINPNHEEARSNYNSLK